jgi:ABC-type nickel/cobalt efflux system permease component RcnA
VVAGALHALSGPDHLAAITPLSISQDRRAWRVGLRWGLGHAAGVALVGTLLLIFHQFLDLDRFSWWSERLVGIVLIGVGVWGLRRATSKWVHSHHHEHDDASHVHIHFHPPGRLTESASAHRHSHTAFAVGLLHGFAGTTHLFGLIPALALPTALAATYLGGYGAGNLLAMGGFAWLMGWAGARLSDWGVKSYRLTLGACSVAAIAVGLAWLVI